jgi:hypothetical protein
LTYFFSCRVWRVSGHCKQKKGQKRKKEKKKEMPRNASRLRQQRKHAKVLAALASPSYSLVSASTPSKAWPVLVVDMLVELTDEEHLVALGQTCRVFHGGVRRRWFNVYDTVDERRDVFGCQHGNSTKSPPITRRDSGDHDKNPLSIKFLQIVSSGCVRTAVMHYRGGVDPDAHDDHKTKDPIIANAVMHGLSQDNLSNAARCRAWTFVERCYPSVIERIVLFAPITPFTCFLKTVRSVDVARLALRAQFATKTFGTRRRHEYDHVIAQEIVRAMLAFAPLDLIQWYVAGCAASLRLPDFAGIMGASDFGPWWGVLVRENLAYASEIIPWLWEWCGRVDDGSRRRRLWLSKLLSIAVQNENLGAIDALLEIARQLNPKTPTLPWSTTWKNCFERAMMDACSADNVRIVRHLAELNGADAFVDPTQQQSRRRRFTFWLDNNGSFLNAAWTKNSFDVVDWLCDRYDVSIHCFMQHILPTESDDNNVNNVELDKTTTTTMFADGSRDERRLVRRFIAAFNDVAPLWLERRARWLIGRYGKEEEGSVPYMQALFCVACGATELDGVAEDVQQECQLRIADLHMIHYCAIVAVNRRRCFNQKKLDIVNLYGRFGLDTGKLDRARKHLLFYPTAL